MSRITILLAGLTIMAAPLPALARSAPNLRDLIGARAAGGERDLQRRGFFITDGHKGSGRSYTYWWNPARRDCVMIQTRDGRFATINDVSAADCNQQNHHGGGGGGGAAAGVAVGALIGAAILAHKSGHHDDGNHYGDGQREADYERGYRDGLHGQAQWRGGNDSYSAGYRSGVEQRRHETTYEPAYGGEGGGWLNLNALVGSRAPGVEQELRSNGFRDVDGFQSGNNGRGVVWYNGRTRQCVQVITVNGRADSVTDIGTHPRCR